MQHTKHPFLSWISILALLFSELITPLVSFATNSSADAVIIDPSISFSANFQGGNVVTTWSKYNHSEGFTYYKVVRSQTNANPVYPDDGYIYCGTDINTLTYTDTSVPNGTNFYRICYVAGSKRYCSQTVATILKGNTTCTDTSWSPEPATVCSGQSFTQTSNCGNTRTKVGTKSCTVSNTGSTNTTPPQIGSCQIFPSDNPWNTDISSYPVHPNSANFINSIGASGHLHADFGGGGAYGIPFVVVDKTTPKIPINFTAYGDESDPGPYPVPLNAPIEWGASSDGDRHVIALEKDSCTLYELYRGFPQSSSWNADSGAKFNLNSNALRPAGWTSADAAGLPIFPGLARYDEVAAGTMNHALRFTVAKTQKSYIAPATHYASNSTDPNLPPMGLRLRLKASYDISGYKGQARVVLNTLKKYGMIVADNGSNWFITGDANAGWNDDDLNALKNVPGSAFEAVDTSASTPAPTPTPTPTPAPIPAPGPTPTPVPPPATSSGALTFNVDASKNRTPISPYIYGRNFGDGNAENLVSSRLGGNRLTGYNWENNASNAGSDWNQSSDNYLGDTNVPGKVVTDFHDKNQSLGMPYSLVTLQMAGYVSLDKNGTVTQDQTAPSSRWDDVIAAKGSAFSLTPNLADGHVYMDELVNFLVQKYGKASTPTGIKGYALDNEPALWPSTHPRIHPAKTTVKEMIDKSIALSTAVKNVDSSAEIFGPVTYGFAENYRLQDAPDWSTYGGTYATYIDAYLAKLKQASDAAGKRLLDVLDIHWYPEAQGTNASGGKTRITDDNNDPGVAQARMQAPRSLWDPSYHEDSWISQWFFDTAFPLIPKLKSSIDTNYPGTKLAVTEFDYGGRNHISGGIATADVLGIFGKYGVYLATYWGDVTGYVSSAYKLYRNYDGAKSTFGDTEIDATNPDIENTSIYASTEGNGGKAHIILINKKSAPVLAHINLANISGNQADIYGFDATSTTLRKFANVSITGNAFEYTIPATSAIHIVISGTSTSAPAPVVAPPPSSSGSGPSTSTSSSGPSSSGPSSSSSASGPATSAPAVGGGSWAPSIPSTPSSSSSDTPTIPITNGWVQHSTAFSDISDSFAEYDIQDLVDRGVIHGYADGTFRPDQPITRAEFLKIVLKGLNVSIDESVKSTPFRDVTTSWQIPIIAKAADLGIIDSTQAYFRPDDSVSRAEAAKILLKAAKIPGNSDPSYFMDVWDNFTWSMPYINQAYALGVMTGKAGRFRPSDAITRAETAKVVKRIGEFKQ